MIKGASCILVISNLAVILTFVIGGDETENILVSEHDCLVELGFAKPRPFLARRENLNSHVLPAPTTTPHLAVAAFACDRDERALKTYFS